MKREKVLFWAKALNPGVLVVYSIACFSIVSLARYGGVKKRVPVILGCIILLGLWVSWCIHRTIKESKLEKIQGNDNSPAVDDPAIEDRMKRSKVYLTIAGVIFLATSLFTAMDLYKSGTPFHGKLSWFLHDLKNKRQIEFAHNNIYEDGIEGLFEDVQKKISMPEDLYLSSDFTLKFKQDGTITSFDTYLYGKNQDGKTESFLLSYDQKKSNKITLYLRGYTKDDYDKNFKLKPLRDMMKLISLEKSLFQLDQEEYGILYKGVCSWGYNSTGVFYIDPKGNIRLPDTPEEEIWGYTVSIYVPGKEDQLTPVRFIDDGINELPQDMGMKDEVPAQWPIGYSYNEGEETFFLDKDLGYQLSVVDAALGSRFYALLKTQDGGTTWDTANEDPYKGDTGVSAGITLIDENLGFIGLSHSGGTYSELYRTEDGGISYEKVFIPSIEMPLATEEKYTPFDYPEMPYEDHGKLYLLVGQGQDGDYNGGAKALYKSEDQGKTWKYVKEVL